MLWNDAGHRLQIERAIMILAAVEPTSQFLSLWSRAEFRQGFYDGLLAADYQPPWNNRLLGKQALYTSHFYDPDHKVNLIRRQPLLWLLEAGIENFRESACSRVEGQSHAAVDSHDRWREKLNDDDLKKAGWELGIASHYFTDLTQPMHTASFANILGFEWSLAKTDDYRHKHFENLSDEIIVKKTNGEFNPNRVDLLSNPAIVELKFQGNLTDLIYETAKFSKNVFESKVKPLMIKLANESRNNSPIREAEGLPAFRESFPAGQINTARFFQQWAQRGFSQNASRLRSDWIAVSECKDSANAPQPCVIYRRDGDLLPVFRWFRDGAWFEDQRVFLGFEFAPGHAGPIPAFAACFDKSTDHPAVFMADPSGKLFYFDAPGPFAEKAWRKTAIELPQGDAVRGAIASAFDERSGKPCAVYRGKEGRLRYVYWDKDGFAVERFADTHHVAGALALTWDPADCGLPEANGHKGHTAISFIAGIDARVNHLHVRAGAWAPVVAFRVAEAGAHADAQMLAAVYDATEKSVGVFWGEVFYEEKLVPEGNDGLKFLQQQPARLSYSLVKAPNELPNRVAQSVVGGISATAEPDVTAHFGVYRPGKNPRIAARRSGRAWTHMSFPESPFGMVSAAQASDGSIFVGSRSVGSGPGDRRLHLARYRAPIGISTGDLVVFKGANGKYLSRMNQDGVDAIAAVKADVDIHSIFHAEIQLDGSVALKADGGTHKWLSRINRGTGHDPIEAARDALDDFSRFVLFPGLAGDVLLRADNGQFWGIADAKGGFRIFARGNGREPESKFKVTRCPAIGPLRTGDLITLKAFNGKFLCKATDGGPDYIRPSQDSVTLECKFRVEVFENGQIALKSNGGNYQYLSQIRHGSVDVIEAAKTAVDEFSRFVVAYPDHDKIAFRCVNGHYFLPLDPAKGYFLTARGAFDTAESFFTIAKV
ncbi:hypothetical protein DBR17_11840 [Sphingomonas sp. HMWF008]|nr:hypothetical protein DBR17_11840 [Sphingomonas sp. HMWF008]